jgi:hypothetical protein
VAPDGVWQQQVQAELERAQAVVVIVSPAYSASANCALELAMIQRAAARRDVAVLAWGRDGEALDGLPGARQLPDLAAVVRAAATLER